MTAARYVNPFTDFGFKKLFGEEASKPLLKDFLNALLPPHARIAELQFKNRERLGASEAERRAIFDLHCEAENGEQFIVEMQKAKQNFFKDRSVYYATFPIQEQAQRGDWDYRLAAVYCIGLLDFCFDERGTDPAHPQEVLHTVQLKNQANQVFYDKLTFLYLEMPHFQKTEEQLSGRLDQWLYFLKHLEDFAEIPRIFGGEEIFAQAFHAAELAALGPDERQAYQRSLKTYRDLGAVVSTAFDDGRAEGRAEGMRTAIERLIASGLPESEARRLLGL